jgi:hypothetical protein
LPPRNAGPDHLDDAGEVAAGDPREVKRHTLLEDTGGEFVIDRVDRRRLDSDQHLAGGRLRDGTVLVMQLLRAAIIVNADRLHFSHDVTSFETDEPGSRSILAIAISPKDNAHKAWQVSEGSSHERF